jgi:hypothetical protein
MESNLYCMNGHDLALGFLIFGGCFMSYEIGRLVELWNRKDK